MFSKKPILQYDSVLDENPNTVVPSKSVLPDWYKKIPKVTLKQEIDDRDVNLIKKCRPFLDAFSMGYMITLPYDLYVKDVDDVPYLMWKGGLEHTPSWRSRVGHEKLVPDGHFAREYVWNTCVSIKIPKGYSLIATHPFNRNDLPFTTITGVIDGDFVMYAHGEIPFYIKQGFEGLIPQGTPIIQVIPFLQQSWESKQTDGLVEEGENHHKLANLVFSAPYKHKFWKRKEYN